MVFTWELGLNADQQVHPRWTESGILERVPGMALNKSSGQLQSAQSGSTALGLNGCDPKMGPLASPLGSKLHDGAHVIKPFPFISQLSSTLLPRVMITGPWNCRMSVAQGAVHGTVVRHGGDTGTFWLCVAELASGWMLDAQVCTLELGRFVTPTMRSFK